MRFFDLLRMSINNLRRRKLRTGLTVLGVVIGTASIVVMVSLGIGLKENTMEQYESYGSLTKIEVHSNYGWGGSDDDEDSFITDKTMDRFAALPHVKAVSPCLSTYVNLKQGAYEGSTRLMGLSQDALAEIELGEGSLPDPKSGTVELVIGNMVSRDFYNSKTGKGFWETGEMPDVDLYNKPFFVVIQDWSSENPSQKKYIFPACGMVKEETDEDGNPLYGEYSYGVYTDIELLKAQLKRIYKKKAIPGQPTNKKGKPYNYFVYENAYVYVDDMDNVMEVQNAITDMGYQAYSNMQWLEQAQEQMDMIQAVLGGIGAVSLFVAAIGIANTMMMSIYERTKEIGVLKVLGCAMGDIRSMFLMEAGFIGFMGGAAGLGLSYGVSKLVNRFLGSSFMGMGSGDISRIPLWLSAAAVVFAIFIGMLAGLFPALRAMKLSPLAAIRNE